MEIKDLAIIGAGPAGMNASIYAKRAGLDVILIEKNAPGGMIVNTYEVENYLGLPKMSGVDLATEMFKTVEDFNVPYAYGDVLTILKEDNIFKITTDVEEIYAKTVILASGTKPRKFNIKGEDKFSYNGISWCAICDGNFYKGEEVVVLGARNSACEEALYLASICKKVTLISRSHIKALKEIEEKVRNTSNIEVIENTDLIEFVGENELSGVLVRDKANEYLIPCKGAFEFIGLIPNTELIKDLADLTEEGYAIASANMATKTSGLYVAGDIVDKPLRQIATAINDGAIAAISASKYLENEF